MATQGKSGPNTITGGNGNDTLNGGASSDVISGGAGNDRLTGGAGADLLDGGAGSDIVNGDSGDDTAVYVLGENAGARDTYDGGSGKDTLQLVMTRAEWLSPAVQADIAAYLAFLAQVIHPVNGEAKNTNFTFSFGLTASKFENLQITVDGVSFDPRDEAVTLVDDLMTAGESAPSIAVDVLLNDSVPDLISALTNTQPAHGAVSLTRVTGPSSDTASFVYTPDAGHWRYLAAGETATDSFTYTVTDADGDTATASVTVTITGTNEAPTLTSAVAEGGVVEDGATATSGVITFADVDLRDAHTVSSTAQGVGYLGTFTATVTDDGANDGAGSVTWDFAVDNAAIQYLAVGQTLVQSYTVTVSDGQGGSVDQVVTVTITGSNDAPVITGADASGGVVEAEPVVGVPAATTPVLGDAEINNGFATAQIIDRADLRIAPNGNLGDQTDASISVQGSIATAADQDVFAITLQAGETLTLDIDFAGGLGGVFGLDSFVFVYDAAGNLVNFNDDASTALGGAGSIRSQDSYLQVTAGQTGTYYVVVKDFDEFGQSSAGAYTLQVSVDSQNAQLTDAGVISFGDLDLIDGHSVSVAAMGSGYLGALSASVSNPSTGDGAGQVAWSFSVANAAVQFLGEGQVLTQDYAVTVADGHGGTVQQIVSITLTGMNDKPVITSAFSAGTVVEGGLLTTGGGIAFGDVDLVDGHTVSTAEELPGYVGTFTAVVANASTGDGAGSVVWSFSVDDAAVAYLAAGQSLLQRYIVTLDDGHGGTTQQLINVSILGTNDGPVITSAVDSGAVVEDGVVTATGAIAFADLDLTDAHSVGSAADGAGYLGTFTASVTDNGAGDGAGSVTWDFAVDNASIQHLSAGEVLTQTYTVTVDDGHGGAAQQTVTVTITGANDAPTLPNSSGLTFNFNDFSTANYWDGDSYSFDAEGFTFDGFYSHPWGYGADGSGMAYTYGTANWSVGGSDGAIRRQDGANFGIDSFSVANFSAGSTATVYGYIDGVVVASQTFNVDNTQRTITLGAAFGNVDEVRFDAPETGDYIFLDNLVIASSGSSVQVTDVAAGTVTGSAATAFFDVDLSDVHTASVAAQGPGYVGTLTVDGVDQSANSVGWTFSADEAALDHLAEGEGVTQSYVLTIDDGHGGTVDQIINVNLLGANDAPTVIAGSSDVSGAVVAEPLETGVVTPPPPISFLVEQYTGFSTNDLNALRNHAASNTANYTATTSVIDFTDDPGGFSGELPGSSPWPAALATGTSGSGGVNDGFFARITSTFSVSTADTYTFRTFNDDGVYLLVDGVLIISDSSYHPEIPFEGSIALAPGNHTIELFFFEGGGEASLELSVRNSTGAFGLLGGAGGGLGGIVNQLTDAGVIVFDDVDLTDVHTVSVAADGGGYLGSLSAVMTADSTGAPTGEVAWTFTVDEGALVSLGEGEVLTQTYTVSISDGFGGTVSQPVTVTLTGINDGPTAVGESVTVGEDDATTLTGAAILANDTDPDGDTLTVVSVNGSSTLGTVQLISGSVVYTPGSAFQHLRPGETATDSFTYTARDPSGATSTATINVLVNGVNDGPTAGDDAAFANANGSVVVSVLANDSDPEGDALAVTGVGSAAHGTAVVNADGSVTYTPVAGYSGTDSFTYTVQDAFGAQSTASVSIVVGLSDHDAVGGNVFLQGNYMEIGVSASGSLGTSVAAPAGYHPQGQSGISYVVDTDGWTSGAAPRAGDFTLPGSPVDSIVVGFNGTSYAQDERSGRRQIATTTTDISTATLLGARTTGLVGGSLVFTQTITLDPSATYYITTITVENVSGAAMNDVRFMRSFDPDQDQYRYGNYTTYNDVLSNPTAGNDLAIARAQGPNSGVSVNLVAFDEDARASNFGFANYNTYVNQAYAAPVDLNGQLVDQAITLTFSFGNLAAGQSATKTFYTTLNGSSGANDMLVGTNGADTLDAGAGNDIIVGLAGNDSLRGGTGNDRFVFTTGAGVDRILDFTAGAGTDDVIELRGLGIDDMIELRAHAAQIGLDVVIDLGAGSSVTLVNVDLANLSADDFWFVG